MYQLSFNIAVIEINNDYGNKEFLENKSEV
jgi:hypothetical protein